MGYVDGDDTAVSRCQIGDEVKHRAVVGQKFVLGFHHVNQAHKVALAGEVVVVETVARVGAFPDGEEEVTAVVAHLGQKAQIRRIWAGVNQRVVALRRAEAMQIDLLVGAGGCVGQFAGGGVAGVEKAGIIGQPGGLGELAPLDQVVGVLAGVCVADADFLPIAAADGERVGN